MVIVNKARELMQTCLIPDCNSVGTHRAPGSEHDWLCCEHYEQFIAHLLDPKRNPTFPLVQDRLSSAVAPD
jgi:hypothetical protein